MKLNAPKFITFLIALIAAVVGVLTALKAIPFIPDAAGLWILVGGFVLLALANILKGL